MPGQTGVCAGGGCGRGETRAAAAAHRSALASGSARWRFRCDYSCRRAQSNWNSTDELTSFPPADRHQERQCTCSLVPVWAKEYTCTPCALNSPCCIQRLNQCDFSVPCKIIFPELIMALSGALSLPKWLANYYLLSVLTGNERLIRLFRTH